MTSGDILLLGGSGFIGRALACRLMEAGRVVHVINRRPASVDFLSDDAIRWLKSQLSQVLPRCGTVIHLASVTTPGSSAAEPLGEVGNLLPTLALLESLQAFPDIHLIYFSSGGTVYGNPRSLPVDEDAPLQPVSYHGAAKAAQEMFLQAFRARGHAVTVLRPANAYGPGQELRNGFGLVRTLMDKALHGQPIEVWGDGSAVRDFIFVEDIVAACMRLMDSPGRGGTYNVGSGVGTSINALIGLVGEVMGVPVRVTHHTARSGDVARVVLDNRRLCRLGWAPSIDLAEGLRLTAEWMQGRQ